MVSFFGVSQATLENARMIPEGNTVPSNIERYKVDYEVVNYTFIDGDSTILEQIDLNFLEQFRRPDYDSRVEDPVTGLHVLLYGSMKKEGSHNINLESE